MSPATIVVGTRASALARWQTRRIAAWIEDTAATARVEERVIRTTGDIDQTASLHDIGGTGVFTHELERALRDGEIDVAVHSLKDLPIESSPGICLAAVCFRDDPRDVLVSRTGATLSELPRGALIGTSSPRREAQLRSARSDARAESIRGNVETRVAKVDAGEFDAAILAAAGLRRLGLEARIAEYLDVAAFLPAPGQGALAVQCRANDAGMCAMLGRLDDASVRACTDAERAFLAGLGGGCSLPVGALAELTSATAIRLRGFVGSARSGRAVWPVTEGGLANAVSIGVGLARIALDEGAAELMR